MTRATGYWTAWAAIIMVLGAWLRLASLGAMEFKGDEQEVVTLAMQLLADHPWTGSWAWPTHGIISSNGVGNAPLFTWIIAAMWAVAPGPVAVTRIVALVNIACFYPLWRWARRRMDEERALFTLAIIAVSPFAVLFSRKIWAPDVMLPGVLAVLWGIEWLRGGKVWRGVALLLAAALIVGQLHQSGPIALALLPIAIVAQLVADRRRVEGGFAVSMPSAFEWAALVLLLALNVFFWLPHLDYVLALPPGTLAKRPQLGAVNFELLWRTKAQIVPTDLNYVFEPHWDDFLKSPWRSWFYRAAVALGTPLYFYGLWRAVLSPFSLPVLTVWWALVIAVFGLARIPVHPWYVLTLAPLTAVLVSGALDGPMGRRWIPRVLTWWRIAYVAALMGLTVTTGVWLIGRGGAAGDYGVAYVIRAAQARFIKNALVAAPAEHFYELGELGPAEHVSPVCGRVPPELNWMVRQLDPAHRDVPDSLHLCDKWIEQGGGFAYRWTVQKD